jgi:hypothetical protein
MLLLKKVKNMVGITLKENHRDPIVDDLLTIYEQAAERGLSLGTSGTNGTSKK